MLNGISSLLALLSSNSSEGLTPRFWALVLESEGDYALLESKGEQIQVKLETAVRPGEKLLLARGMITEGRIQCRILQRLTPNEQIGQLPDTVTMMFYPDQNQLFPYLLTVEEQDHPENSMHNMRMWKFTLQTENLGAIVLVVNETEGVLAAQLLVENGRTVQQLARLRQLFGSENTSGLIIHRIRVMTEAERSRVFGTGVTLDQRG